IARGRSGNTRRCGGVPTRSAPVRPAGLRRTEEVPVATGELVHDDHAETVDPADLPWGAAVTESGRISRAQEYVPAAPKGPFTTQQLSRIDEALALSSRETGIEFS